MWLVGLTIVTAMMIILRIAIIFDATTRKRLLRYVYGGKPGTTVSIYRSVDNYNLNIK